jgi:Tfp pilus assembly major pilin PilA
MTLEEFNYIAEIIASIAVIASLLYAGLQVKQNTAATIANARVGKRDFP